MQGMPHNARPGLHIWPLRRQDIHKARYKTHLIVHEFYDTSIIIAISSFLAANVTKRHFPDNTMK